MTRKILTDKGVAAAQPAPKGKRVNLWDGVTPSLALRITDKGHKSWIIQRRTNGKMVRITLGTYPALELGEARDRATATLRDLTRGRDPRQTKPRVTATILRADSFEGAAQSFIAREVNKDRRPATAEQIIRALRNEFIPRWSSQPLNGITRADVQEALDEIVASGRPVLANRARSALSVFFSWAVEREMVDANLAAAVRRPSKESSRSRVLSDDEIREVWIAARSLGWPFASFFRALIISGQRRSEIAGMSWQEIARKERIWTIPGARTKNGREHLVHLATPFEQILDEATRFDEDDDDAGDESAVVPIFTTDGKRPVSGFSRAKRRLDVAIVEGRRKAAIEAGEDPKKVRAPAPWTLHDLRRSAASGMARVGVAPFVIESALNHVSGFRSGVSGIYQRHDFLAERRAAFDRWGAHIVELVDQNRTAGKVVNLVGRR